MPLADVSVIIPTYNRLKFLKKSIESVFRQTWTPKEFWVVDDASTDGTWEWLQENRARGLSLLRHTECRGPALARNAAVAQSTSRWIAFLDSDDEWLPTKLETQLKFLAENPQYKICQTEELWIRDGRRVNPMKKHQKPSGDIFIPCLKRCLISPSAVLLERSFFNDLGGFDPDFPVCEDYDLWLRATLKSPVATLPEALTVKYGGHEDQLSRQYWGMDRYRVSSMKKVLYSCDLDKEQKAELLKELAFKLQVLALGFAKRHPELPNPYQKEWDDLKGIHTLESI